MTYTVETWTPGPPDTAWRELARTYDRAAAIAAMLAYAASDPRHYGPTGHGRLRVRERP